jgi:hypothetical protein
MVWEATVSFRPNVEVHDRPRSEFAYEPVIHGPIAQIHWTNVGHSVFFTDRSGGLYGQKMVGPPLIRISLNIVRSQMYIRFVVNAVDLDSGRRVGLFHAARTLCEEGAVSAEEEIALLAIRDRFNENLEKPGAFARSKKPHAKAVAISWFKDSANTHISKMYKLRSILEAHGIQVEILKSAKPGYIVYEDEHQVMADPYAETET